MIARPAVALALLLTFPASTVAQTRLDLKTIKEVAEPHGSTPVALPVFRVSRDFQQQAPPAQPCAESEARGRTDADKRPMSKGWFWGSLAAGAVAGIFAVGGAPAAAATVKPKPKVTPAGVDAGCYSSGFGTKARHENVLAALWGSLIGLPISFLLYAAAGSD